ncbi:MAG TPA: nucleotidyltransferase family protein [Tepidisphaeraceae bacterium]|jgi:hypothetical protein|nr:nucleotidyltransferase family protein [Tepidisphaeraceae bacterium]
MAFRFANPSLAGHADSPERRLLLACAKTTHTEPSLQRIRDIVAEQLDWEIIAGLARRHRVRPLLLESLSKASAESVPDPFMRPLREFAAANARRSLFLTGELFRILELFRSCTIPAAAFKGPILAADAYGNPALREAGDLDLLVRRRDIVKARQLLIEHGFLPGYPTATPREVEYLASLQGRQQVQFLLAHSEHHLLREPGSVNVDLHWALALRQFALRLNGRQLWTWLRPRAKGGREILTFGPEHMLLVLCINGAKDCWHRLDRICDVAELLAAHPELEWPIVLKLARQIGAMRMLCTGLKLAETLLASPLPPIAKQQISMDKSLPAIAGQISDGLFGPPRGEVDEASIAKSWIHLKLRDGLGDRIAYALAQFEPTIGDRAALPLPWALQFLHYAIRPVRLGWRGLQYP